ncbi:hypothetical protein [Pedobacter mendelii]|uniref:hypothetical protein n=1 Tax=Pedobacter mendelii TaxID=1908240 RepID=UPI00166EA7C4|nr:hypothetical protein [Pedobacter mendelii]
MTSIFLGIFEHQHFLIREVFKHHIIYSEGASRTLSIKPIFEHTVLKFKEKGCSFWSNPFQKWGQFPSVLTKIQISNHFIEDLEILMRLIA